MKKYIICSIIFLLISSTGFAQENFEFPQSGVLAANGTLPSGNLALPQLPMGLDGRFVPLIASLTKTRDNHWDFSISNNTKETIRVEFEFAQYDLNLNKISSSSSFFKLKAQKSEQQKVAVVPKSQGAALILKSWSVSK